LDDRLAIKGRLHVLSKVKIALAAALVVASAAAALAESAKRKPVHHAPATLSEGRNAAHAGAGVRLRHRLKGE
jgi:hypothetical protein